ncbi:UNVERIFIED_CONTAM: hypothetical protein Slati_2934700 [Sesamum latifolium]|uniref:Uncharacterized protein n=1 Tax=Sesamum latifolium TaxID=2727402 RepID=A0AAW2VCY5_9LAMI
MHISENEQKAPPVAPSKLRLDNLAPVLIEVSIADMEPFTKAESYFTDAKLYLSYSEMQETVPSKLWTSQLIKEVRSKLTHSKSNAEDFSKLTIGEVPNNENHKSKKPSYSPVFPHVAWSDEKDK